MGTKSLVKIGSVIGELFLIWTKVAKTNVAWTNVTVTVFICLVKTGSVTAEIFLIWTNVAETNVA